MRPRDGSFLPFVANHVERIANADPRLSLTERHGTRDVYVAKVTAAAEALVRDRLLLPEDASRCIARAKAAITLRPDRHLSCLRCRQPH